mgnify:CR=1 FL=1
MAGTRNDNFDADSIRAAITWVNAEVRLYDCLFTDPQPDAGGKNFLDALNPRKPEGGEGLRRVVTGRREAGPEIPV